MTRARVTAQQLTRPPRSARLMRGTVSAVSPLTVQIAGGGAVGGIPIPGAVYTVGGAVLVLVQEPGVGPVYPIPGTTALPPTPYDTATVANAGTVANWATGTNSLTRQGQLVTLRYEVNVGGSPPQSGGILGTIPAGFRPAASLFLIAILWNGWNNNRAEIQVEPDGRILFQSASGPYPASSGVFLNATYSLV